MWSPDQLALRVLDGLLSQAGGSSSNPMYTIGFIAVMIGIFYLMLWRPQQKQAKEHRAMLTALKKGDAVVTQGGIIGRVSSVADKFVILEAGRDVRLRVLKQSITGKAPEGLMESES